MVLWYIILSGLFSLGSRSCAELVPALPGQPGDVSFRQYSGYIVTDPQHGRALFYYFVEADSNDPHKYPLTLLFNGGPGCSSLGFGAFMEHGPFRPAEDGTLMRNKYSWNKASNMLYVESPIGVGFSYSNTTSDYENLNDTTTASDNLQFLLKWFDKFPEYRHSDLYIAGESYAGHYVPQLAALLLDYNKHYKASLVKLKAIALGNPLLSIDNRNAGEFLWSHGVISDKMLVLLKTECNYSRYIVEVIHNDLSKECLEVSSLFYKEMEPYTDSGNILASECLANSLVMQFPSTIMMDSLRVQTASRSDAISSPCLGDWIYSYLNSHEVQEALHANTTKLPGPWGFCLGPYQLDNLIIDIIPTVTNILKKGVQVLLFSGDQDTKIPLTNTREVANKLAQELNFTPLSTYAPWYDKTQKNLIQIGGWSQSFGTSKGDKNVTYLTFATVRGAAHEVPYTSPSQALTLFKAYLEGSPLPSTPF